MHTYMHVRSLPAAPHTCQTPPRIHTYVHTCIHTCTVSSCSTSHLTNAARRRCGGA